MMPLEAAQNALQADGALRRCHGATDGEKAPTGFLGAWSIVDLERYAASVADLPRTQAYGEFCRYAIAQGWSGTPAWPEARKRFRIAHWSARHGVIHVMNEPINARASLHMKTGG